MGRRKTVPYEADDEFFAQIEFLRNDYNRKRQTIRSMLKINAAIMSGVVSCILPEDFLTMASGNPA